jgi:hypothetical protein
VDKHEHTDTPAGSAVSFQKLIFIIIANVYEIRSVKKLHSKLQVLSIRPT